MARRRPPKSNAPSKPTGTDIRRVLGLLDDSQVCRVLDTGADMEQLQQAGAALNGELPPHIGRPLTGPAARIYDMLSAEEDDDPGSPRRGPAVER